MPKKQFTSSFQDIFSPTIEVKPILKPQSADIPRSEADIEDIQRTTILLSKTTYTTIKAIAYWERRQIKDVIQQGLDQIIREYTTEQIAQMKEEFEKNGGA